eukprot:7944229-Alexandrium_andersonii.AAC.1
MCIRDSPLAPVATVKAAPGATSCGDARRSVPSGGMAGPRTVWPLVLGGRAIRRASCSVAG